MTGDPLTIDRALVGIGQVIGKPPGWERVVRALAPPERFSGGPLRPRMVDGTVFPVDVGTLVGWSVHFFGSYEPEVREQIRRWLKPGDAAVDVGANVGWHALLMASIVGPGGRVYAFEPNDSTRARLLEAVAVNACAQVVVDSRAVSDRLGRAGFAAPPAGHVWDGTGRLTADVDPTGGVECVTLDRVVTEGGLERLALIKADVEGWEPSVLAGAVTTLRDLRPVVLFEYDPAYVTRSGSSGGALAARLLDAGYRLFKLKPGSAPRSVGGLSAGGNYLGVPREREA